METKKDILMTQMDDGKGGYYYVPSTNPLVRLPDGKAVTPYEESFYKGVAARPYPRIPRMLTPESLLGDKCTGADPYACDRSRDMPPFSSDVGEPALSGTILDYTTVGPLGQMRAATRFLYASETLNNTRYALVGATPNFTASVPAYPTSGAALGIRLDWGVALNNFAPFDLQIVTTGFKNKAGQSVDRALTLRVYKTNGCSIYIPFAQRTTGMSVAQSQIGQADEESGATIAVMNLPAPSIFDNFSATASLLTAFSPVTAAYAALEQIISD